MIFPFLITAILFFVLGQHLPDWLRFIVSTIQKERLLSRISPVEVDEFLLCTEPHEWLLAPHTVDENGELTYTNLCKHCGFIPALNLMATKEGMEHIKNNKERLEEDERTREEFIRLEEVGIRKHFAEELKNGLEFRKLEEIYMAGQNMKERFILYRLYKSTEQTKEAETKHG